MYIYRYMYTHSDTHTHCAHLSSVFCFHFKNDQATLFPKTDDWNHQLRRLMLLVLRPKRFIGPCWKGKPLGRLGQLVFRFRILEMQCIVIYIYNIYIYNIYIYWTHVDPSILDFCLPISWQLSGVFQADQVTTTKDMWEAMGVAPLHQN